MVDSKILINQHKVTKLIEEAKEKLIQQEVGSLIFVSGEIGAGKTFVLRYLNNKFQNNTGIISYYTECSKPLGKFNISEIQALQPFANLVDDIIKKKLITPEKKLAVSIGLTTLAAIPVFGEFFYAIKELAKDWRQYKLEKSSKTFEKMNSLVADFYDTIASFVDKNKLVFFIDNIDYADVLTIELLRFLAYKINEHKLLIIASYTPNFDQAQKLHFTKFLQEFNSQPYFTQVNLIPFEINDIIELINIYLTEVKNKFELARWILDVSKGNPSSVMAYLDYFSKNKSVLYSLEEGELAKFSLIPGSTYSVVSDLIKDLSEEEKNLLAICSAEGKQFSVLIVSRLINEDTLTTVRKLKSLQNKSGLIRSLGYQNKYGQKTTVYEFTQTAYYEHFYNSLEYEEKIFLKTTISSYLKQLFESSENEYVKQQLAPYIAAYSTETGDIDTANAMLKYTAMYSQNFGNIDLIENLYNEFLKINSEMNSKNYDELHSEFIQILNNLKDSNLIINIKDNNETNNTEISLNNISIEDIDEYFSKILKIASEFIYQKNFIQASNITIEFYEKFKSRTNNFQIIQVLLLAVKSLIYLNDFEQAQNYLNIAKTILDGKDEPFLKCLLLNVESEFFLRKGDELKAYELLKEAAELSLNLTEDLQLLTLANIALYLNEKSPDEAKEYFEAINKISKKLNFTDFGKIFSSRINN